MKMHMVKLKSVHHTIVLAIWLNAQPGLSFCLTFVRPPCVSFEMEISYSRKLQFDPCDRDDGVCIMRKYSSH